jgi:hypothetical protein
LPTIINEVVMSWDLDRGYWNEEFSERTPDDFCNWSYSAYREALKDRDYYRDRLRHYKDDKLKYNKMNIYEKIVYRLGFVRLHPADR